MLKSILIIATILTNSACARTVYVTTPLALPDEPEYIKIPAAELECLSDSAYTNLVILTEQRRWYIDTLREIIKTTHD